MQGLLQGMPTTAAEDEALLARHYAAASSTQDNSVSANGRMSDRQAQAVRTRLEWKLLVGQGLELLQAYEEYLQQIQIK